MALLAASQGFTLALSMIMPIGTQNSMLLNQGINKNYHLITATLFILYDVILISIGVLGGSLVLASNDTLFTLLTWGGMAFLFCYGALSFKAALVSTQEDESTTQSKQKSVKMVIIATLMVTFLNPHAYIDTVMVIGSVGGQYIGDAKLYFLFGAITGSIVWFLSVALAAAKLSVVLSKAKVKRMIDIFIGLVMWFIAWSLYMSWLTR